MPQNMTTIDRGLRALGAVLVLAAGVAVGADSAIGIALFAVAGVLLATSAVGYCPLYAVLHLDRRGEKPLPH